MEISVNNQKVHAFFIGDKGAVLVPYDGDSIKEYSPLQYSIPDLETALQDARFMKRCNSVCKQYDRILAYCEANNIKV
jgi:hypothetical protein